MYETKHNICQLGRRLCTLMKFCEGSHSFERILAIGLSVEFLPATTYKACTGICEHSATPVAYPGGERECV